MHDHHHSSITSTEEALALLEYMAHHNEHHTEELHELAHYFESDELHQACVAYHKANQILAEAIKVIKEK